MNIDELLKKMIEVNASDLHLKVGSPPSYRINGEIQPLGTQPLTPTDTEMLLDSIIPINKKEIFEDIGTADFAYSLPGIARFRVNAFHQRGSISMAIRIVNQKIPTIEELNLPEAVKKFTKYTRGLVLITGMTGSGKSTTLAALINEINNTRPCHIITIEDPIEYLHKDNLAIINQMEIGTDTKSFEIALKHVLRQDPDVILIGELRDKETVKIALAAAETGHLVFGTLHTPDAKQTLNRILHFFSAEEEGLILLQLSLNLRGVISQRLLQRKDGMGRIPAVEILINTPIVSKMISERKILEINQAIQNREEGMQTFNQALVDLYKKNLVTLEEAEKNSDDPPALRRMIEGGYSSADRGGIIASF